MSKPKMALLVDLGSLKVSCDGFRKLLDEIESKYDVVFVKFYSYVAKRNRDFNEFISAKGYDAVTPIASRRRNRLDTRQVIDGTKIALNSTVDAVGIAYGEGDIIPIVTELKQTGKDVVEVGVEKGAYSEVFSSFIPVNVNFLRDGYAAPTKKRAKKEPKTVAPKETNPYIDDINKIFSGSSILSKYSKK